MNSQLFVACFLLGLIQARTTFKRYHHARQVSTECGENRVKCPASDRCIPQSWFCDGDNDCGDDSDEPPTCPQRICEEGRFKCTTRNRCISVSQLCNGYDDCGDNSDEPADCSSRPCPQGYLRCNNGQCIDRTSYCNYGSSCQDRTPLHTQTTCPDVQCGSDSTKCERQSMCIDNRNVCDGYSNCGDGSDEPDNCRDRVCPAGKFKCIRGQCIDTVGYCTRSGYRSWGCNDFTSMASACVNVRCPEGFAKCPSDGSCIRNNELCDGVPQCSDSWDESRRQCHAPLECPPGKASCPGVRLCIDENLFCDTDNDCGDNSDEDTAYCGSRVCGVNEVRCDNGQCLDKVAFCGEQTQCRDGSLQPTDNICTMTTPCPNGTARCPGQRRCINKQYFCDGDDDCGDRSDEAKELCSSRSCEQNQVNCNSGQCIDNGGFCGQFLSCRDNSVRPSNSTCSQTPWQYASRYQSECLENVGRRVGFCVKAQMTNMFAGIRYTDNGVLQKVVDTPLGELCSNVQQVFVCGANWMKFCDGVNNPLLEIVRRYIDTGRTALSYVCFQHIDVISRHKACLLRTNQTRYREQVVLERAFIEACVTDLDPTLRHQPVCLPRSMQACAKRIVANQCGDEIAEVLDGLAELVRSSAKCPDGDHQGPHGNTRRGFPFDFDALKAFF